MRAALLLLLGACLLASGSAEAADKRTLTLTGASTVAPLVAEIAKRYESLHRDVRIDVQTGGSSRGVRDARTGLADIGMASRSLYENESELTAHTIAMDGISIIVHKTNPIRSLTRQQIIDIYTGKVRDWSEVGPLKGRIIVENKAEGRSTLDLFVDYFKLNVTQIRADVIVGDNEHAVKVVAGNPMAIGYVSIGSTEYEAENGTPIRALPLDGIEPTMEAVATKKFPIIRELNLVVKAQPSPLARDFLAFAQSDRVNDLIKDLFFVPLR
jgi:phosphate transport system substrate-binding protein